MGGHDAVQLLGHISPTPATRSAATAPPSASPAAHPLLSIRRIRLTRWFPTTAGRRRSTGQPSPAKAWRREGTRRLRASLSCGPCDSLSVLRNHEHHRQRRQVDRPTIARDVDRRGKLCLAHGTHSRHFSRQDEPKLAAAVPVVDGKDIELSLASPGGPVNPTRGVALGGCCLHANRRNRSDESSTGAKPSISATTRLSPSHCLANGASGSASHRPRSRTSDRWPLRKGSAKPCSESPPP